MQRFIFIIFFSFFNSVIYGQFKAVHIPGDRLNTMKMDGDTSDWNWVPQKYLIIKQSMSKVTSPNDNDNWDCWIKVGWNESNHKLYIVAKITDDIFMTENKRSHNNDGMQFAINPDSKGGRYGFGGENDRTKHTIKGALISISDTRAKLSINVGPEWLQGNEDQYIDWNIKHRNREEGGYERIYEMSLNLLDEWENEDPEHSLPTELYPYKKIRLALVFNDSDAPDNTANEWTNLTGRNWWLNADEIPEFILEMPPKIGVSWRGIQYVLNQ